MKTKLTIMLGALALTGAMFCADTCTTHTRVLAATTQGFNADDDDMRERDEKDGRFQLAPGAEVTVNSLSGSVKIETADTDMAEVHVVRTAHTREALECRPVRLEQTGAGLRIDGQDDRRQCRNAHVNQSVTLRLPRRVRLNVNSISGHVTVGDIDGPASFNSISGHVTVGNVRGAVSCHSISGHVEITSALDAASFTSISGHVTINVSRLGARGLKAQSISGSVDVGLSDDVNADVHVESISGSVTADGTRITVNKMSANEFTGRVGTGGAPLEFFSISGNIRLHRVGV